MGNIQKITTITLVFLVFAGPLASSAITPTGNFMHTTDNITYYPESQGHLQVANLTIGYFYGLLLGANQNLTDQQWINFTATNSIMNIPFVHFVGQQYLDNRSQDIEVLYCILYGITSNSDTSPVQLDTLNIYLIRTKDQLNPYFIAMLVIVGLGSLFVFTIIFALIKQFF